MLIVLIIFGLKPCPVPSNNSTCIILHYALFFCIYVCKWLCCVFLFCFFKGNFHIGTFSWIITAGPSDCFSSLQSNVGVKWKKEIEPSNTERRKKTKPTNKTNLTFFIVVASCQILGWNLYSHSNSVYLCGCWDEMEILPYDCGKDGKHISHNTSMGIF